MDGCGHGQGEPTQQWTEASPNFVVPPLEGTKGDGLILDPMTLPFNDDNLYCSISELLDGGVEDHDHDDLSRFSLSDPSDFLNSLPPQDPFGMPQQQAQPPVSTLLTQAQPQVASPSVLGMTGSIDFPHSEQGVKSSYVNADNCPSDGYNWRMYGQKLVKDFVLTRSYYMCTHQDCPAKKKVLHCLDGDVREINYKGNHTHQPPHPSNLNLNGSSHMQESQQAIVQHVSGSTERQKVGVHEVVEKNDDPNTKTRNAGSSVLDIASSLRIRSSSKHRLIVQTISDDDIIDDGFKWRKYGQKVIKGNPNPRSYYKCTALGCKVQKRVERSPADLRVVITTYVGQHDHDVPL